MDKVQIKVNDFYGNPSYYSVMPQEIFDVLELASLKGEQNADINKDLFDGMIEAYKTKMMKRESK
ncbi:MAG: hypothetical protein PUK16_01055 [Prevotellaceae bacterium]|nr:hypothetical protein [Prevotellaceae bacterium]